MIYHDSWHRVFPYIYICIFTCIALSIVSYLYISSCLGDRNPKDLQLSSILEVWKRWEGLSYRDALWRSFL